MLPTVETSPDRAAPVYSRFSEETIRTMLADTRVVAIVGPRQSGKTTLARTLAASVPGTAYEYITLDDEVMRSAALADPMRFIGRIDRAVIDEVQRAPSLTLAIKQSVDDDKRPGRFLLTGSSEFLTVPKAVDSLAGRAEAAELLPLAQGEIQGRPSPRFIDRVFADDMPTGRGPQAVELALAGGYPEAILRKTDRRRRDWHRAYVTALLERDLRDVAKIDRWDKMPVLFELLARSSGQILNWSKFGGQIGLDAKTVERYVTILEQLFLVRRVPAWSGSEVQRIVSSAKLHFLDSGLLASTLEMTSASLTFDRSAFGPVLESYVFSELVKALPHAQSRPRILHYRDRDQVEVDFVLEDVKRRLVAIEVKAAQTITLADFKGLKRFQGHVGKRLVAGIVLYDGAKVVPFGPSLYAVPLAALWD